MLEIDQVLVIFGSSWALVLAISLLRALINIAKEYVLEIKCKIHIYNWEKRIYTKLTSGFSYDKCERYDELIAMQLVIASLITAILGVFFTSYIGLAIGVISVLMWFILRILRFAFRIKKKVAKDIEF